MKQIFLFSNNILLWKNTFSHSYITKHSSEKQNIVYTYTSHKTRLNVYGVSHGAAYLLLILHNTQNTQVKETHWKN